MRSLAAELAIQRVSHCSLTRRRRRPAAPRSGVWPGLRDPSVSADVLFSECGQPVFDAGDRSRAVLMVLFVAQQRGQCGGVGESLHRRRDFADGEVVVIVDGQFIFDQAAGQHAGAVQRGLGAACPFSGGDLLGFKQCGVAPGGQGIDRGFGDGADP